MGKTTAIEKHPCRDCLVASVCKQKKWLDLIGDCRTLNSYLFKTTNEVPYTTTMYRVNKTFDELFPNTWKPANANTASWVYECRVVKK